MENESGCQHLRDFLAVQITTIQNHIDEHKWCNRIPDENEGVADFIQKYGWLMREFYCGYICEDRAVCKASQAKKEAV